MSFAAQAGRAAAWSAAVAVGLALAAALVLEARAPANVPIFGEATSLRSLTPIISVVMGAIVIERKGNHPVGWLFVLSGLAWAGYALGVATASYVAAGNDVPGGAVLLSSSAWLSTLAFGLSPILVVYLFPDGRPVSRGWAWCFAAVVAILLLGSLGTALTPGPLEDIPRFRNALGVGGTAGTVARIGRELSWPFLLAAMIAGVVSLRRRYSNASFDQRQQMKWLLLAGVTLALFVCFWGVMDILGRPQVAAAAGGVFLPLLPIALGIAILRHRLYDIDILINRTLVYVSLSAVLAGVYLVAVVVLQRALAPLTTESNFAVAVSTLGVAALFRPLRGRIQEFIDRRFYRAKYDASATVEQFSLRLRDAVQLETLEGELLAVVRDTLQPSTAGVWLHPQDSTP